MPRIRHTTQASRQRISEPQKVKNRTENAKHREKTDEYVPDT